MKTLRWLDAHFEGAMLAILLVCIAIVELLQVIFRNLPFVPALTWAEEFCRFCWVWSVFLSLPYCIRKGCMLRVSLLPDLLNGKARAILEILVDLITIAAMLLLGVHAVGVADGVRASGETSPAMRLPMGLVYRIMLPGFFLGALRGAQQLARHLRMLGRKRR